MNTVTTNHTHFSLPVDVQFLAIKTTWTAGENSDGERVLFPAVNQNSTRKTSPTDPPDAIRRRFFKTDFDEESALDFLNSVGVWAAIPDTKVQDWKAGTVDARRRFMRLWGAFGHRAIYGRALVVTVESLRDEQNYWRERLPRSTQSRTRLKETFRASTDAEPAGLREHRAIETFLGFGNTLPIHLEWRGKHPHGVIQPITGRETLAALAWVDLVTEAEVRVCAKCGTEYTRGGWRFCSPQCEHANTVGEWRKRKRTAALEAANGTTSITKKARKSLPRKRLTP